MDQRGVNEVRSDDLRAQHARELEFHDALAAEFDAASMPPQPLSRLDQAMLADAAPLPGERVLDLGCGSGDLTLELAASGADVTAIDLSPRMVEVAARRVELFVPGATCRFVAGPIETSGLPDRSFDLIVGRFILHHLDIGIVAPELVRLLTDGGRAAFGENSGGNPILNFARQHLAGRLGIPRMGTTDEHPLTKADIAALAPSFSNVAVDFPVFEFFFLFDRQVLQFRSPVASRVINALDRFVYQRIPAARPYSFRMIVSLRR